MFRALIKTSAPSVAVVAVLAADGDQVLCGVDAVLLAHLRERSARTASTPRTTFPRATSASASRMSVSAAGSLSTSSVSSMAADSAGPSSAEPGISMSRIVPGYAGTLPYPFRLAYFRPAHTLADDALVQYEENRLSVTRQLHYSTREPDRSLDLVLFVNGIPVATAELKNPLTGQTVEHAKEQYRRDRDPRELLFARRALVHFAVDPELVFITTRLAGKATRFLPFNTGSDGPGVDGGAGNPPAGSAGYRTSYLWERVWQPEAWLDLIRRFLHVENGDGDGRRRCVHDKPMIFPRYHQWHAVRTLTEHAATLGSGHNYLVQHSAGSGKSNTIAWLAHRLSNLHSDANEPVFDKVVVISDRSVLDTQLQDTVYQFEHRAGIVKKISNSDGAKSEQVAQALAGETTKILIVTLQTFPHVLEKVSGLRGKRFAIIVDEAHSSQSGESSAALKKV